MTTQARKLNRLVHTHGILGATFREARTVGTDDVSFFPSPHHPAPPGLVSVLAESLATLDTCGRAGLLVKAGIRLKFDREGYSILVMDGPDGTVAIAYLSGHPVVKSVNRPARSISGHRARRGVRDLRSREEASEPRSVGDVG